MNAIERIKEYQALDQAAYEMYNALQVICKDPVISNWLYIADPKALKQCQNACFVYLNRNDKEWMESYNSSQIALDHVTL